MTVRDNKDNKGPLIFLLYRYYRVKGPPQEDLKIRGRGGKAPEDYNLINKPPSF